MELEFLNWAKYNPRKDIKRPSWFRLENNIIENPDFYEFSASEFKALIYLMCLASKKDGKPFVVNFKHAKVVGQLPGQSVKNVIKKLEQLEVVHVHVTDTLRTRHVNVTDAYATNERTNITNEHNEHNGTREVAGPRTLVCLWNKHSHESLPKVDEKRFKSGTERWDSASARMREEPNQAYWTEVIQRISSSEFCLGENDRKWKADFDFLIRQQTHTKVLEGKYDQSAPNPKSHAQRVSAANAALAKKVMDGGI